MKEQQCVFCAIWEERKPEILFDSRDFFAVHSIHPVEKGHSLIISKKHHHDVFLLTPDEWHDFPLLLDRLKTYLDHMFSPAGYNIGTNSGRVAGQSVFHFHVHVIPRYVGKISELIPREYKVN